MDNNELSNSQESRDLPPFHHESEDVGAACGINMEREGGILDARRDIIKRLKEMFPNKGCTSAVVETIETQPNLNFREKILVALLMGQAKGVADAPHVLGRMLEAIEREKGGDLDEDFDF